ncbi:hypothetical protein, partial [uncultured Campylobacter sp.]|uniref:hypothetical protein n=1 Tax=uncultured Campylobacter sp. TaxID=218934 RepID=UPI0026177B14
SIPRLFLSFGADVLPSKDRYPSFPAAFMGYWKDNPTLKWKVSMNVKINLSPLHDDFRLNKNFKILRIKIYVTLAGRGAEPHSQARTLFEPRSQTDKF